MQTTRTTQTDSNTPPRLDAAFMTPAPVEIHKVEDCTPQGRRLCYLLSRYPAVSHTFFQNEIRELRKLGLTIDVASINPPDWPEQTTPSLVAAEAATTYYIKSIQPLRAAGITIKTFVRRPQVFLRGLAAALQLRRGDLFVTVYALFYFIEALILGDWMKTHRYEHLHIHFGGPVATVGMLTSIAWEIPYSLMVHGPDEFYDVEYFYLQQKIERAKFVLCISNYCRSQLMRITAPKHWDKMHVIRLGVDPKFFAPAHNERPRNGVQEILCVGRLVPSKGQLVLLRTCASLLSEGHSLKLRFVGGGSDQKHLEDFVAEHNLSAYVIFEGARNHDETRRLLQNTDIFALASFAEGVPVALMEAMAMEIPCVSTYVAGIPELIRDGLDGLLVPPSSEEALASALRRLINDPGLRRSLGISGRQRVLDLYNLQENVRSLATVFEEHLPVSV
jgi:colanic acid/amylovoran biosynthesis glycosyltransferase